jgi:hypothetical protein
MIKAAEAGVSMIEPISDEEKRQEAELEALCRKVTEEDPGYCGRLVDRVLAEIEAEGGGVPMEEFLGLPPAEEGQ